MGVLQFGSVAHNFESSSLPAPRGLIRITRSTDDSFCRSAEQAKIIRSRLALRWASIGERLTSIRPFAWAGPDTLDSSGHVPKE